MKKILYYEDDAFLAGMMKAKLEAAGFLVDHHSSPVDVIRDAKTYRPDLIFMDIIMPRMDGFTATAHLKADHDTRSIPVFGMSNLGQDEDRARALATGMVDYWVSAEHSPTEVVEKIRTLLGLTSHVKPSTAEKAITVHEMLVGLDRLNRSSTWSGLNAAQLEALVEVDRDEWERAGRDYTRWRTDYHRTRQYTPHVVAGVALLAFVLIHDWRPVSGLVALIFGYWAAHRDGHSAGYVIGYEIGRRNAILDDRGVSEEDAAAMRDKALQMSVEARAARSVSRKHPGAM